MGASTLKSLAAFRYSRGTGQKLAAHAVGQMYDVNTPGGSSCAGLQD